MIHRKIHVQKDRNRQLSTDSEIRKKAYQFYFTNNLFNVDHLNAAVNSSCIMTQ